MRYPSSFYVPQFDCDHLNGHELFRDTDDDAQPQRRPTNQLEHTPDGLVHVGEHALRRIERIASLDEDSCCSFDEWANAGYRVRRGERSMFRDITGIPQFTKEQVDKMTPTYGG